MGLNIRRTGAPEYGRTVKMLVCGRPGAGKTLFSSTAPNPIFASAEGGLMSIADKGIPYVDIKGTLELLQLRVALDQEPHVREQMLGFPVDTVVIDTIDEIQRILIRERLEDQKKEAMTLPDWGWLSGQMQSIIGGFRSLDMNTIFTCHLKSSEDSETGKVWQDPGLQGAVADQIPAAVDLAVVLRVDSVAAVEDGKAVKREVRRLITSPSPQYPWLKDRSGKLPHEIEINFEDDFKRIESLIFGGIDQLQERESIVVSTPDPTPVVEEEVTSVEATVVEVPEQETTPEPEPEPQPEPQPEPVAKEEPQPERIIPKNPKKKAEEASDTTCASCGAEVTKDIADLCRIRRVKDADGQPMVLCMTHYREWKAENT